MYMCVLQTQTCTCIPKHTYTYLYPKHIYTYLYHKHTYTHIYLYPKHTYTYLYPKHTHIYIYHEYTPGNITSGKPSLSTEKVFLLIRYGKSLVSCCKSPRIILRARDTVMPCLPLAFGAAFFINDKWRVLKSVS